MLLIASILAVLVVAQKFICMDGPAATTAMHIVMMPAQRQASLREAIVGKCGGERFPSKRLVGGRSNKQHEAEPQPKPQLRNWRVDVVAMPKWGGVARAIRAEGLVDWGGRD